MDWDVIDFRGFAYHELPTLSFQVAMKDGLPSAREVCQLFRASFGVRAPFRQTRLSLSARPYFTTPPLMESGGRIRTDICKAFAACDTE